MTILPKREIFYSIVGLITIAFLTTVLVLYTVGYRLDLTSRTLEPSSLIKITTNPSNALIYIDDEYINKNSNTDVAGIEIGTISLDLTKEGYSDFNSEVTLEDNKVEFFEYVELFKTNPLIKLNSTISYTGNQILNGEYLYYISKNKIYKMNVINNRTEELLNTDIFTNSTDVKILNVSLDNSQLLVNINLNSISQLFWLNTNTGTLLNISEYNNDKVMFFNNTDLLFFENTTLYKFNYISREKELLAENVTDIKYNREEDIYLTKDDTGVTVYNTNFEELKKYTREINLSDVNYFSTYSTSIVKDIASLEYSIESSNYNSVFSNIDTIIASKRFLSIKDKEEYKVIDLEKDAIKESRECTVFNSGSKYFSEFYFYTLNNGIINFTDYDCSNTYSLDVANQQILDVYIENKTIYGYALSDGNINTYSIDLK